MPTQACQARDHRAKLLKLVAKSWQSLQYVVAESGNTISGIDAVGARPKNCTLITSISALSPNIPQGYCGVIADRSRPQAHLRWRTGDQNGTPCALREVLCHLQVGSITETRGAPHSLSACQTACFSIAHCRGTHSMWSSGVPGSSQRDAVVTASPAGCGPHPAGMAGLWMG